MDGVARRDEPGPTGPGSVLRARRQWVVAVLVIVAFATWLLTNSAGAWTRMSVSDVMFMVAPAAATVSCARAARRRGPDAAAWGWVAAGCGMWCLGSVTWAVYELALHIVAPFPSAADIFFIGYAIPMLVGVVKFSRLPWRTSWSLPRLVADAASIAGALLFASAILVLRPMLAVPASTFTRLDALGYPLVDVSLAAAVLSLSSSFVRAQGRRWIALSVGLLTLGATDSTYVAGTVLGHYSPGHITDLGWLVSFVLIAVAGGMDRSSAPEQPSGERTVQAPSLGQQLLPLLALLVAGFAYSRDPADFGHGGRYFWATIGLLATVVARQAFVAAENASLTRGLADAVNRRTADLSARERWWAALVRNLTDVIIVVDRSGQVSYCSPGVRTALGHWPQAITALSRLRTQVHPSDLAALSDALDPVMRGEQSHSKLVCRIRRMDGRWSWFELTALGADDIAAASDSMVLILHDVTEQRRLTDQLSFQAFHDPLTGLPNRARLMQEVDRALRDDDAPIALGLLDLDDFKLVNDTHGHQAGDALLKAVAERLRSAVRRHDLVVRLGGDEFAVLMRDASTDVGELADRIVSAVSGPVVIDARQFNVRASIGVVFSELDAGESAATLLAHADIALYEAKDRNRGRAIVIRGEQRSAAAEQVRLRQLIAHPPLEEFRVEYQPMLDLQDGRLNAVEALLRWDRPGLGAVSPEKFISLAEQAGSIDELGWHVIETACAQLGEWIRQAPEAGLRLGVNISVQQLHVPGFVDRVSDLLQLQGILPDQLVLEITEQSLARDFETVVSVVAELRRAGISVAVDDFGTGYSSLRYLDRFAADVVKIDRSFTANLVASPHTRTLLESVVQMTRSLGMQSVVEGIETEAQLQIARELGFEVGQGYLFARPLRPEQVTALLASGTELWPHPAADSAADSFGLPQQRADAPYPAAISLL